MSFWGRIPSCCSTQHSCRNDCLVKKSFVAQIQIRPVKLSFVVQIQTRSVKKSFVPEIQIRLVKKSFVAQIQIRPVMKSFVAQIQIRRSTLEINLLLFSALPTLSVACPEFT